MIVPTTGYTANAAYAHLASGLCCGFSSLAAGLAIGIVGDAGVRANAQQDKIFVGMILILIFGEALALYGLIVSLILTSQGWFAIPLSFSISLSYPSYPPEYPP